MSFHEKLRQRYSRFNQSQLSLTEKLYQELNSLEQYLRITLGMDKCYKKVITDTEPTEAYLRVHNPIVIEENADMPSVRFELLIVLDESEDTYPKKTFSQPFELRYIQADRMVLTFLPPTNAKFVINLIDDEQCKFRHFAESYQQFLLHKLTRG